MDFADLHNSFGPCNNWVTLHAGINKALKRHGIVEGDMVTIGEAELTWSDNQSEAALYDAWVSDRKAKGKVAQGSSRWPHPGG